MSLRRPWVRRSLVSTLVLALSLVLVPGALAEPSSDELREDLADLEARYERIDRQRGEAQNAYNDALERLEQAETTLEDLRTELAGLRDDAAALRDAVTDHVRLLHKSGPGVELSTLLTTDPTQAHLRSTTLRHVLDRQRGDLEDLAATEDAIAAAEDRQAAAVEVAETTTVELEERNEELEQLFEETADDVEAYERRIAATVRREEAEERARQAALAEQERAAAQQTRAASSQDTSAPPSQPEPAPSTRRSVDVAVQTALAQLGKPYQWGGNGPGSFDCSGLVVYSFRAAGVTSLPRSSSAQYNATARISRADLKPGDLVFYHRPVSHVAIYIGGGRVVEAPNSGNNVRIRNDGLTRSGVVGYGRVR